MGIYKYGIGNDPLNGSWKMAKRKQRPKPAPRGGYQFNGVWHTYYDLGHSTGREIKKVGQSSTEMLSGFSPDWVNAKGETKKGEALGYPRSYYQGLKDGLGLKVKTTVTRRIKTREQGVHNVRFTVDKPETTPRVLEFRKWCRDNANAVARWYKSGGTTEGLHGLWKSQAG